MPAFDVLAVMATFAGLAVVLIAARSLNVLLCKLKRDFKAASLF